MSTLALRARPRRAVIGLALLLAGCTSTARAPSPPEPTSLAPNAPPPSADRTPSRTDDALRAAIDDLVRPHGGTAGVAFRIIETGQAFELRGAQAFPMASTYKFPMALTWLRQVDEGRASLQQTFQLAPADLVVYHSPLAEEHPSGGTFTLRELLRWMMVQSDNTACDVLLARLGGPAAVRSNLARLGVVGIRVDRSETEMAVDLLEAARPGAVTARDRGFLNALDASLSPEEREVYFTAYQSDPRDRATPNAMLELLVQFHRGTALGPTTSSLLRSMMIAAKSRLGLKLPSGVEVANKTGTGMGSFNDVGIVTLPDGRHLALAVFVAGARGLDLDAGSALVADVARAVYDSVP